MNKKISSKIIASVVLSSIVVCSAIPTFASTKDEVVYSDLDSTGKSYSTTVSSKISNDDNSEFINDISNLMNITNTSGDETFDQNGNEIVWNAKGNTISYRGETDKELPITTSVKYELDGEEISSEDLAGKTGHVKITIKYQNNDSHIETINGKRVTMYTPFVVVAGTIVDSDNNKNVTINKGKILENGTKMIAMGIAMPGLKESLDISDRDIEIPDSIEIEMDATDFEMNNIISYVTPKVLEEDDLDLFDNIDDIYSQVNELQDASNKLVDGTSQLRDGVVTLNRGTHELSKSLNSVISQYEYERKQLANKEKIEEQIVSIVNEEFEKLLPNIKEEAKEEAKKAIANHETDLENSVVETSLKYTNNEVNEQLEKIEKNNSLLTDEQKKQLEQAIEKDIQEVLGEMETDEQFKALEKAVQESVIEVIKETVGSETENAVNNAIDTMSKQGLSQEEQNALSAQTSQIVTNKITEIINQKTVEYMKQGMSQQDAINKAKQDVNDENLVSILSDVAGTTTTKTATTVANATLNKVKDSASTISNDVVDKAVQKASTISSEELKQATEAYKNQIATKVAQKLNIQNEEMMSKIQESIKNKLIESLKEKLSSDEVLKAYEKAARNEINASINKVANETAVELAQNYTETLANEVANNLIEKTLSGTLSSSELDEELSKYENIINSTLNNVDSKVAELKSALSQLTNGTDELENGSNELADGMNQFNEEGIKKISDLVNGDVKDLSDRLEVLKDLANEYNNFSGISENDEGTVSFIEIIDSIKKKDENKTEKTEASNTTNEVVANETITNNTMNDTSSSNE